MLGLKEWQEVCKKYKVRMRWHPDNKFASKEEFAECLEFLIDMSDNIIRDEEE